MGASDPRPGPHPVTVARSMADSGPARRPVLGGDQGPRVDTIVPMLSTGLCAHTAFSTSLGADDVQPAVGPVLELGAS
jgi:hypothetical protein